MTPAHDQSLVLHQYLALRRSGLDALTAVRGLSETLPEGPMRRAAVTAARRLSGPPEAPPSDELTRALADPSTGEAQARLLTRSLDVTFELEAARRLTATMLQVVLAGPLVMLAAAGWFPLESVTGGGVALPAPTQLVLELGQVMQFCGLPVALVLIAALSRWKSLPVFGARPLKEARALFDAAVQVEPARALLAADVRPAPKSLARALAERMPPRDALTRVAETLAAEGHRHVETWRALVALALGAFLAVTLGGVLVALYLPVFSIAGSIQ